MSWALLTRGDNLNNLVGIGAKSGLVDQSHARSRCCVFSSLFAEAQGCLYDAGFDCFETWFSCRANCKIRHDLPGALLFVQISIS